MKTHIGLMFVLCSACTISSSGSGPVVEAGVDSWLDPLDSGWDAGLVDVAKPDAASDVVTDVADDHQDYAISVADGYCFWGFSCFPSQFAGLYGNEMQCQTQVALNLHAEGLRCFDSCGPGIRALVPQDGGHCDLAARFPYSCDDCCTGHAMICR